MSSAASQHEAEKTQLRAEIEQLQRELAAKGSEVRDKESNIQTLTAEVAKLRDMSRTYVEKVREERKEERKAIVHVVMEEVFSIVQARINPNDVTDGQSVLKVVKEALKTVTKNTVGI